MVRAPKCPAGALGPVMGLACVEDGPDSAGIRVFGRCSSEVEHQGLALKVVGSSPIIGALNVAQWVEH